MQSVPAIKVHIIYPLFFLLLMAAMPVHSQQPGPNDTIRVSGVFIDGQSYPYIFLDEVPVTATIIDAAERARLNKLRNDVYTVYSYALTAGEVFKKVSADLEKIDDRRARKKYLKSMDKQLDAAFKQPLKNLSIDQGHVLISLINRQTGDNCYNVIKELKGGLSAMMWQGVGVFFNNNLTRAYEPNGRDKDIENIARDLEASASYKYQLYLQGELMKKISKR